MKDRITKRIAELEAMAEEVKRDAELRISAFKTAAHELSLLLEENTPCDDTPSSDLSSLPPSA